MTKQGKSTAISQQLLRAIARTGSGMLPNAENRNTNGSADAARYYRELLSASMPKLIVLPANV